MAGEVHMTPKAAAITAGTVAAPVTINFKRLGFNFNLPSNESNVDDAGEFEGNVVENPDQELVINFTARITASQQLDALRAIFDGSAEKMEILEGGTGAVKHEFFRVTCSFDFNSAEEGSTVNLTINAQGWKQAAETYGFQG